MKNALKTAISLILVLCFVFSFAGCYEDYTETESSDYIEFDVDKFEQELRHNVKYEAKFPEESLKSSVLGIHFPTLPKKESGEPIVKGDFWVGEDVATADLILLMKTDDEKDTDTIVKWAQDHKASLIETYSDYDAEEVKKIENAVIRKNGKFVVFVITDDYKTAQGIVDKHWS